MIDTIYESCLDFTKKDSVAKSTQTLTFTSEIVKGDQFYIFFVYRVISPVTRRVLRGMSPSTCVLPASKEIFNLSSTLLWDELSQTVSPKNYDIISNKCLKIQSLACFLNININYQQWVEIANILKENWFKLYTLMPRFFFYFLFWCHCSHQ